MLRRIGLGLLSSLLVIVPCQAQRSATDQAIELYRRQQVEAELNMLKQPLVFEPGGQTYGSIGTGVLPPAPVQDQEYILPSESYFLPSPQPTSEFPTIEIGGLAQADCYWFDQDTINIASVGDAQDGADFRRARLHARGNVYDNVAYMLEVDFVFLGRTNFADVWLNIEDTLPFGDVKIGYFRQPIGMDALTAATELTFIERSLPSAFVPFRQIAISLDHVAADERSTFSVSTYRFPTDFLGANVGDNGGFGFGARYTILPFWSGRPDRLFHLGAAFTFANPANDRIRFATPPEFFALENAIFAPAGVPAGVPFYLDTGAVAANNFGILNLELAGVHNRFHYQGETYFTSVNTIGGGRANFFGSYAQLGYFLTGEIKPYNRKKGVLTRIEPLCPVSKSGGWGAWELATRWSYLDLNDGNVTGGRLNNVTLGANWYWNPRTQFQFNYIHSFLADPTFGNSESGIWAFRAQIDF